MRSDRGATLVEYVLVAALLFTLTIGAVTYLTDSMRDEMEHEQHCVGAVPGTPEVADCGYEEDS